jgi:hypothetical protein
MHSEGELYTVLLSGFRLPWPPFCCLNAPTPFVVSDKRAVRRFNTAFGSCSIAPTKSAPSMRRATPIKRAKDDSRLLSLDDLDLFANFEWARGAVREMIQYTVT